MIEAGAISIRAVWSDAEARQAADKFYADLKRKRDEAMAGGATAGPGQAQMIGGGRPDPGTWRGVGGTRFGGNNIWIDPSNWRNTPIPGVGGAGGGGRPPGIAAAAGGGGEFPNWMMGWRSQLPPAQQAQQIPDWLVGWQSPVNRGPRGGGQGVGWGHGGGIGSGIMNRLAGAGSVYVMAHLTNRLMQLDQQQRHLEGTYELHGVAAGAQEQLGRVESAGPLVSFLRNHIPGVQAQQERRELLTGYIENFKDRAAMVGIRGEARGTNLTVEKMRQEAAGEGVRDDFRRRQMDIKNDADNAQAERYMRQATLEDQYEAEADPFEKRRIGMRLGAFNRLTPGFNAAIREKEAAQQNRLEEDERIEARQRNTSAEQIRLRRLQNEGGAEWVGFYEQRLHARETLSGKNLAAEEKRIDEEQKTQDRGVELRQLSLHNATRVSQLEFEDKPLSAQAEKIGLDAQLAAQKVKTKEEITGELQLGKLNLQNMMKEITRSSFAEEFDPRTAAFGQLDSSQETTDSLQSTIEKLTNTLESLLLKWK